MRRRLRRAVSIALLVLGALGLVLTASGVWTGGPWPWLVVLALGVLAQVAGDHYAARQRLVRRIDRRFKALEEEFHRERRKSIQATAELARRIESVGTPEGMKALVENVNRMAADLGPIVEEWKSVRAAGGLRAMVNRRGP